MFKKEFASNYRFESYSTFNKVETVWSNILPPNHHLLCKDIKALEVSNPADINFNYVNIFRNNKLIGVMYVQCLNFNKKHYNHSIFDKNVLKLLKECIVKQSVNILICGNIFRVNFQGFYFVDKTDKESIFDCLQLYRKSIKKEKEICGILVKDCSREFDETQFTCHKFNSFKQDLTMEMKIESDWKTFESYTSDLSRKYRQRASKIRKSLLEIQIKELTIEEIQNYKGRIDELYLNIVNKQSLALGILNVNYFLEMKLALQDKFKLFGFFKNNELLAFSSHIYYPLKNRMEIHYIGLDYNFNQEFNLYFNILFNGIEQAIEGKYNSIEMGRTAREAKANAGAYPVENYNYVWIKPGLIKIAVKFIGSWFDRNIGEDWLKRSPFKTKSNNEPSLKSVQNHS
jgi:hypothetical protein